MRRKKRRFNSKRVIALILAVLLMLQTVAVSSYAQTDSTSSVKTSSTGASTSEKSDAQASKSDTTTVEESTAQDSTLSAIGTVVEDEDTSSDDGSISEEDSEQSTLQDAEAENEENNSEESGKNSEQNSNKQETEGAKKSQTESKSEESSEKETKTEETAGSLAGLAKKNIKKMAANNKADKDLTWLKAALTSTSSGTTNSGSLSDDGQSLTVNTAQALILLSQVKPSLYENMTITITRLDSTSVFDLANGTVSYDGASYSFLGLSSSDAPFQGEVKYTEGSVGVIHLGQTPLFWGISDKAKCENGFVLAGAAEEASEYVLFADVFTHDDSVTQPAQWKLTIQDSISDNTQDSQPDIGGIIGTMQAGCQLQLSLTINTEADIKSATHAGIFCNEMKAGASLTIASYTTSSTATMSSKAKATKQIDNIEAENGDAGAFVGRMDTGAKLILKDEVNLSFTGEIIASGNAGGLIGSAEDVEINFGTAQISIQNTTIQAGKTAVSGGLVGSYTYKGGTASATHSLDLKNIKLSDISLAGGQTTGGLFGILDNQSKSGEIAINNTGKSSTDVAIHSTLTVEGATSYGGLIGSYTASSLSSSLKIQSLSVESKQGETTTNYGGVIGMVTGTNAAYISMQDVVTTTTQKISSQEATVENYGGLVANLSDGGHMLDISTVTVVASTYGSADNGSAGGLVGNMESGVLRLSGTTDLSEANPIQITSSHCAYYGQLVGRRGSVLIYALGSGADANGTSGWTFKRCAATKTSDIGNWGEVVRLTGDSGNGLSESQDGLLNFDQSAHTVTVCSISAKSGTVEIRNIADFATVALNIQLYQASLAGALRFGTGAAALSSMKLSLTADINLGDTGILGFMRDDASNIAKFSGTLDGGNHKITLTIGESYGLRDGAVATGDGSGRIYSYNNNYSNNTYINIVKVHQYLGLFAQISGAMVQNLTVGGILNFSLLNGGNSSSKVDAAALAAYIEKGINLSSVTIETNITYGDSETTATSIATVAGLIGEAVKSGSLTVTIQNCQWVSGSSITNNCKRNEYTNTENYYIGGFIAYVNGTGSEISIKDSTISGTIEIVNDTSAYYAPVGGLIAEIPTENSSITTLAIQNLTVNGVNIKTKTKNDVYSATGGLLGYKWNSTHVEITGTTIQGCTLTSENTSFGGLVYRATGYWHVYTGDNTKGISFEQQNGQANTFTAKSFDTNPSGLLVAHGEGTYSLYMEIEAEAYQIAKDAVKLTNEYETFDEIVGVTISTNGNGVVSIATDKQHSKIDMDGKCNTYQSQLGKTYTNSHTRYYYNVDLYRRQTVDADGTVKDAATGTNGDCSFNVETINNAQYLLLWSLRQYSASNLKSYFCKYTEANNITGTIDLTGYSYYPVDMSRTVYIANATITFDNQTMNKIEQGASNKTLDDTSRQHYLMHMGLFKDVTVDNLTVKNLTLRGTVGTNSTYSGAFICGTFVGGTTASVRNLTINGLTLDGIRLVQKNGTDYTTDIGDASYKPLFIHELIQSVVLTVSNVTTTTAYTDSEKKTTAKVATSLIGNISAIRDNSVYRLDVIFSNMKLDARSTTGTVAVYNTYRSIFTKSTFANSIVANNNSYIGQYNFNTEDNLKESDGSYTGNVTYGKEISNVDAGRNPDKQHWYYDNLNREKDKDYVSDPTNGDTTDFSKGYLPYIAVSQDENMSHLELDVNQRSDETAEGCGTYSDPYIINANNAKYLERVANYIKSNTAENNFQITINPQVMANYCGDHNAVNTVEDIVIQYNTGTHLWKNATDDTDTKTYSYSQIQLYLSNAYYKITGNISLSEEFEGLGGSDATTGGSNGIAFSGTIYGEALSDGQYPTVEITPPKSAEQYGGLIKYSQGSVIENLNIVFTGNFTVSVSGIPGNGYNAGTTTEGTKYYNIPTEIGGSFFGGVVGYCMGGDTIIDNVNIDFSALTLQASGTIASDNTDGTFATYQVDSTGKLVAQSAKYTVDVPYLASIGGYVGLVGGYVESVSGDIRRGGGVIFKNMQTSSDSSLNALGLTETVTAVYQDKNVDVSVTNEDSTYYYYNPYIGRILDGYAAYDVANSHSEKTLLESLENSDKNYTIPSLTSEDEVGLTIDDSRNLTVSSEQGLWLLSAIVNSGAGSMNTSGVYSYNNDNKDSSKSAFGLSWAYYYGKVRTGIADDENYWGGTNGLSKDNGEKVDNNITKRLSYLIKNFCDDNQKLAQLTYYTNEYASSNNTKPDRNTTFTLSFKKEKTFDMSGYGNGFRGIGGSYMWNTNGSYPTRTIPFTTVNGNDCSIQLNMCRQAYLVEEADKKSPSNTLDGDSPDRGTWSIMGVGLFPILNMTNGTVQNMSISGCSQLNIYQGATGEICTTQAQVASVGGLAGAFEDTSNNLNYSVEFAQIHLKSLQVSGSRAAGGILGACGTTTNKNQHRMHRNITFTDCDYTDLEVTGDGAAGGFIGFFRPNNEADNVNCTITVQYTTDTKDTTVKTVELDGTITSKLASNFNYLGAGGLVGVMISGNSRKKNLFVNSDQVAQIIFTNLTVQGQGSIATDTNKGGIGGILGTANNASSGEIAVKNVTFQNLILKGTDDASSWNCDNRFAGGVLGNINGDNTTVTLENILIEPGANDKVEITNAKFCGGLIGRLSTKKPTTITNCTIRGTEVDGKSNILIYNDKNKESYVGGAIGSSLASTVSISIDGFTIQNAILAVHHNTNSGVGGVIGNVNNDSLVFTIHNTTVENCILVGDSQYTRIGTIAGKLSGISSLKGYNILSKDNIEGYYISGGKLSGFSTKNTPFDQVFSMENIGLCQGSTYATYAALKDKITSSSSYTGGYIGLWVGDANGKLIQLVGISSSGDGRPNQETGVTANAASYFVYADYKASTKALSSKDTTYPDGFDTATLAYPYVTSNAYSTAGNLTITGDGALPAAALSPLAKIVSDYSEKAKTQRNEIYSHVSSDVISAFNTNGEYISNLSTYSASGDNGDLPEGLNNFAVLEINTNKIEEVNTLINSYISLVTNTEYSDSTTTQLYTKIQPTTYQWDEAKGKFIQAENATMAWDAKKGQIRVKSGQYDNTKNQFTLLDVQYLDPSNANSVAYHLYIPVVVKKVLNFSFTASILSGTDYYAQDYAQASSQVLASHGEQITAYLTFEYEQEQEKWQESVDAGDDLLWNFNKTIYMGDTALPSGTRLTLIDSNNGSQAYILTVDEATFDTTGGNSILNFSQFTELGNENSSWENIPLCDYLALSATEDTDGTFVKLDVTSMEQASAEGATVRVKDGESYSYYRPVSDDSTEDSVATKYKIVVGKTENVQENYYLTIQTPSETTAIISNNIEFKDSSLKGGQLPTYKSNKNTQNGNENQYILGDFFSQNLSVTTETSNVIMSTESPTIEAVLTTQIQFTDDKAASIFKAYTGKLEVYQNFVMQLQQYDASGKAEPVSLAAGTVVKVWYDMPELDGEDSSGVPTKDNPKVYHISQPQSSYELLYPDRFSAQSIVKYINQYGAKGFALTAHVEITYTDDGLYNQFPERDNGDTTSGIEVCAKSNLAFSTNALQNTSISTPVTKDNADNYYYREAMQLASLDYHAYEVDTGDATGAISQLGINANDLDVNPVPVVSVGEYDVSNLTNIEQAEQIRYELTLYQKNDNGQYEQVDLDKYLEDVTIQNQEEQFVSGKTEKIQGKTGISLTEDWTSDPNLPLDIPVNFSVKTDSEFEAQTYMYANYRIVLTMKLLDKDGKVLDGSEVSDYLVYTNARVYTQILSGTNSAASLSN